MAREPDYSRTHLTIATFEILQLCNMDDIEILSVFSGVKCVTLSRSGLRRSAGRRELTSPTVLTLKECSGPFNLKDSFLFPNISLELVDTGDFVYPALYEGNTIFRFSDIHCLASGMPSLRELSLNNVYLLSDRQAMSLLSELSHLTRLCVIERRASNDPKCRVVTQFLLKYLQEESTLLEIESIKLIWSADNPIEESMVMDMLEGRPGLKEVVVGIRDGVDLEKKTLARVKTLRQWGMTARVW